MFLNNNIPEALCNHLYLHMFELLFCRFLNP